MALGENQVNIVIKARDEFSSTFKNVNLGLANFRKAAMGVAAVSAGIALAMGAAINSGIELESAMIGVRKTTGMTADEISILRDEFIGLSKEMPLTATDLATIGEVAGQLGIQGTEDIRSFTEVVAKMSIATELTAEDAALALAKISNAMGLPISEAENLGSVINELSNISAASSSEIISAMTRVSGSAKTLGLSTDVVAGLSAALIASGEPAERAGTKLRSAFDQVVKNIDKVEQVIPGFADKLRTDANGAMLELITTISKIEDPIEKQKTAMDLFGTVGASAINKLSGNLPEMNKLLEESNKQFKDGTSLQEEYLIAIESLDNQMQLVKNQFTALGLELADVLIPIIRDYLLPAITTVIDWFSNLSPVTKQLIVVLGLVTIAVGALAGAIAIITLVSSPWLLIIGAIILAITGIVMLITHWGAILESFRTGKLLPLTNFFKTVFGPILLVIQLAIKALGMAFSWLWDNKIKPLWDFMKPLYVWLKDKFLGILGSIVDKIKWVVDKGSGIYDAVSSGISAIGGGGKTETVGDAIIRPNGDVIKTHPDDTLLAMKNFDGKGTDSENITNIFYNITIDKAIGLDETDLSEALSDELGKKVSL